MKLPADLQRPGNLDKRGNKAYWWHVLYNNTPSPTQTHTCTHTLCVHVVFVLFTWHQSALLSHYLNNKIPQFSFMLSSQIDVVRSTVSITSVNSCFSKPFSRNCRQNKISNSYTFLYFQRALLTDWSEISLIRRFSRKKKQCVENICNLKKMRLL